jgi:hypothetical protein
MAQSMLTKRETVPHTGTVLYQREKYRDQFQYKTNNYVLRMTQSDVTPALTVSDLFVMDAGLDAPGTGFDVTHMLDIDQRTSPRKVYGEMNLMDALGHDLDIDNEGSLASSTMCAFARVEEGNIKFDMDMTCMSCNMSCAL